ncbi:hypothetical protein OESDEN_09692 [Oesophagostomum dentatum]|uniref:Uncharacterized protein n=1 Tax=Oesophagostomum dentatum TaxID=61180 RepID=A0A0B1T4Y7_OESDE|nr:hypothetical protein OESDEN_09692 [Oesophagostomum dentatum]
MMHRVTHAVIYSTNEIVVKVKLHTLDNTALNELNLTLEKATSRENVPVCSEELFRERHSSEIIRI